MPRAKVVRINKSLYLNVPAEEARRLHLQEGQVVDFDVKPVGSTVDGIVRELRGKFKGKLKEIPDAELWGDSWSGR